MIIHILKGHGTQKNIHYIYTNIYSSMHTYTQAYTFPQMRFLTDSKPFHVCICTNGCWKFLNSIHFPSPDQMAKHFVEERLISWAKDFSALTYTFCVALMNLTILLKVESSKKFRTSLYTPTSLTQETQVNSLSCSHLSPNPQTKQTSA